MSAVATPAALLRALEEVKNQEDLVQQLETLVGLCARDAAFRLAVACSNVEFESQSSIAN